jgi:hypothetical protein
MGLVDRGPGRPPSQAATPPASSGKARRDRPIDDALRKQLLFRLTHEHNVFSLGRFATWRNILLDDVVDDIVQVKRLLKSGSAYDVRRAAA